MIPHKFGHKCFNITVSSHKINGSCFQINISLTNSHLVNTLDNREPCWHLFCGKSIFFTKCTVVGQGKIYVEASSKLPTEALFNVTDLCILDIGG